MLGCRFKPYLLATTVVVVLVLVAVAVVVVLAVAKAYIEVPSHPKLENE